MSTIHIDDKLRVELQIDIINRIARGGRKWVIYHDNDGREPVAGYLVAVTEAFGWIVLQTNGQSTFFRNSDLLMLEVFDEP